MEEKVEEGKSEGRIRSDGVPGSSVARLIAFHLEKPYIGFPEFCGPLN